MRKIAPLIICFWLLTFSLPTLYASEKEIVIDLWEFSVAEYMMSNLLEKFEKENPGIKVRLQQLTWEYGIDKLLTSIAAGNPPDVCELGTTWIPKFAQAGELIDITGDVEGVKEDYFLLESATFKNRIYGIPWLAGTRVMFYNRTMFEKAGLDPERPPATWEELLTAAKKIHSPKDGVYGFSIFVGEQESPWQQFLPFAWGNGARILSDDLTESLIYSGEMLETLRFYKRLSRYSLIERQTQVNELFAEGKVGMQISGSWNLRLIPSLNPKLNFGVALLPRPSWYKGFSASFGGGELFVISKRTRHPEEALRLIRFLTRKDNVMQIVKLQQNVVPAIKGCDEDPYYLSHPRQKLFLTQLETAVSPPNHKHWDSMQEHITYMVEEAVMKDSPAEDVLGRADAKIREDIKEDTGKESITDKLIAILALLFLAAATGISVLVRKIKIRRSALPKQKTDMRAYLYISPWIITFLVFGLYPLIYSIVISLSKYDFLNSQFTLVGLKNYISVIKDTSFHRALWHTFIFSIGTVPFTVGLALFCSVILSRKIPFKQFYQAGLFLPVTTSVIVMATVFAYIYSPQGLANWILDKLGIVHPQSSWLTNPASKFGISVPLLSIMAMNVWASFGYYTVLFLAGLSTIPEQYYEVARLDGATDWQQFKFITLPLLRPMILLVVVINTIYSFQAFPEILTMTRGGPLGRTKTIVYHLYDVGFHKFQMGPASAIAYILLVILIFLALAQMKLFRMGEELQE